MQMISFLSISYSFFLFSLPSQAKTTPGHKCCPSEPDNEGEIVVPSAKKRKINKKVKPSLATVQWLCATWNWPCRSRLRSETMMLLNYSGPCFPWARHPHFSHSSYTARTCPLKRLGTTSLVPSSLIQQPRTACQCLRKGISDIILGAHANERKACLIKLVKNAQQVVKYILPGLVGNDMNEKVLTSHEVFPADDVKLHLGLTGANSKKSFMILYDYMHHIAYFIYTHYLTISVLCWQVTFKVWAILCSICA